MDSCIYPSLLPGELKLILLLAVTIACAAWSDCVSPLNKKQLTLFIYIPRIAARDLGFIVQMKARDT